MKKKVIGILLLLIISVHTVVYGDGLTNADTYTYSGGILKIVTVVLAFMVVLVLTYLTTRFIGNKANMFNRSQNINIIEQRNLDRNNKLVIAKILDKHYILSVSNNNVSVIEKIEDESVVKVIEKKEIHQNQFSKVLKKAIDKKLKRERNGINKEEEQ
ncbi:flagellar biosynthetic protein FliO [Clostridiaceae bacterium M8S5]|nr:flagellar biosynthetic protein FliO [Clostridiaceae bacterium M8S5]